MPEGIRAYVTDIKTSLQCYTDVQMGDGPGMILRCVSGYVPKFSGSFTSEWLNDAASDYSVARRVLTDYHPLERHYSLCCGGLHVSQTVLFSVSSYQCPGRAICQSVSSSTMSARGATKPSRSWPSHTIGRMSNRPVQNSNWKLSESTTSATSLPCCSPTKV